MVRVDAVVVDGRPLKLARRRSEADGLLSLQDGGEETSIGPFSHSVRSFIARHGRIAPPVVPQLRTWKIAFRIGSAAEDEVYTVDLDVVEEDVAMSKRVYCDHCRIVGWSENPVCRARYHFIIRNENSRTSPHKQLCSHCGALLCLSELRCSSCNHEMTNLNAEEWAFAQLEDPTHLMHGLVHSNGYGHLLRINGRESGSKTLTGCDLMEFWDRLCKLLHVRKVSVMDVSKKHGLEYRLLHGVTTGHPWYGNWGYQFGAGSFGHTPEAYQKALDTLSSMPLSPFTSQSQSSQLRDTIAFYMFLSSQKLRTLRDLFSFITRLLDDCYNEKNPQARTTGKKKHTEPTTMCTWKEEDVRRAEDILIKILRAVKQSKWVTWRALQGATFRSIGSPELLDYCLTRLHGRQVGDGLVVAVKYNNESSSIEYRLEPCSDKPTQSLCRPSKECLVHDLRLLYDALLSPVTMQPYVPQSIWESSKKSLSQLLLDCKQFVKHYDKAKDMVGVNPFVLRVWCHVELIDKSKDYLACPPELIVLSRNATVADLKLEAAKAFHEMYLSMQSFQPETVLIDGEYAHDVAQISFLLRPYDSVRVCGHIEDGIMFENFRMERGTECWTVDCTCGAKDDDGERMLTCDRCGVWKHTRCSGINDLEEVPAKFICSSCIRMPKHRGKGRRNITSPLEQEMPR